MAWESLNGGAGASGGAVTNPFVTSISMSTEANQVWTAPGFLFQSQSPIGRALSVERRRHRVVSAARTVSKGRSCGGSAAETMGVSGTVLALGLIGLLV